MLKLNSKEQNIFFTSDTHGYHKNITRGVTEWSENTGLRDFDTIEEMTDAIIDGINKYVKQDDILFHLGDWTFGGIGNILRFRNRIICKNIHLIGGNHDLHIYNNKLVGGSSETYAQDLFTTFSEGSKLIQVDKKLVYMSHFPCEDARFDKPSFHIHGHKHGKWNEDNLTKNRLDVGIDSAKMIFGKYKPFNWEEIKEEFNGK